MGKTGNSPVFWYDKKLFYSQDCGIRIQGNRSRSFVQKSFNLYARKTYDGNNSFDYDFFGTGYIPDKLTLFSGADDTLSKLRDNLVSSLVKDRDITTMNYEPYIVFWMENIGEYITSQKNMIVDILNIIM